MAQQDRINGLVGNLGVKAPCNVATTGPLSALSGAQTVDGYSCTSTDNNGQGTRVLVKDQTNPVDNGIYYCNDSAWTRAPDFDGAGDVAQGTRVFVSGGTVNGNTEWVLTTANPINIGVTSLAFTAYAVLGSAIASNIHSAAAKTSLVGADELGFWDSVSAAFRKITFTNLLATLANTFAALATTNAFSKAQRGTPVALTSTAASIAVDLSLANNFTHATTENTTLAAPTNPVAGQSGAIIITQGNPVRTLAFNSFWKFPGGTVPALTATVGAVDVLIYYVESNARATCQLLGDVK